MRRAMIIGAGIAGLATALRLSRDGWSVEIRERAPARRTGGYVVNLTGAGLDAAERLGLLPALRERDLGLITTTLVRADGRPKFSVPAPIGLRAVTVFRGDLETVLYDAVRDHADLRFGATAGIDADADLVIGADGLHSATRGSLFGADFQVGLPYVVGAFPVPSGGPTGVASTYIGPGRTAGLMNFGPGRAAAFFTWRTDDPGAEVARGPMPALRRAFGDLGGVLGDALRTDPADVYFDTVSQVVMPRWSAGRVVLIGDAAWCVTLFAGHGAGLALTGADRLGDALRAGPDVPAALAAWERALRPETVKRQMTARRGMRQFAPPSAFHVWLGDVSLRALTLPGVRGVVRRALERADR